ncbi:MAG: alpha-glycosidase [Oscillospiraceae bacterium]|nr:alpha-glycosidase [Oscillospiraceae bacterium]
MNLSAISHRSLFTDCYAKNEKEVTLNIRTGKDVTAVNLMFDDPYAYGISGDIHWIGRELPMVLSRELKHHYIYSVTLAPEYRRLQYYFEIFSGEEKVLLFEDDFYTDESIEKPGRLKQYFKFPYLNKCDVISPPEWVADTVWYQIMPDRFCRGGDHQRRMPQKSWEDRDAIGYEDFFGGDLRGIIQKLPYLQELGITGIYLLPVFESDTNHKYNIFDYTRIDPDFGTEEDLIELVSTAHSLGIRVMLDAVFNHSGTAFFAWQDVWEKGERSQYFDWFCIHKTPFERKYASLADGRFDGFAFLDNMPKLNTGNPEVAAYFENICAHWVKDWGIDGIRFDVGNEVSHSFLKGLRRSLKQLNPDLFLLGEIWHDAAPWLMGDEYDSVMNYPFFESMHNFWVDENATSRDLMYAMERVYSLYPEQINRVLFNHLDTHDTMRSRNRCGSLDAFYHQQTMLMTLPGTVCIYYGTEIAMPGGHDPDCRKTMPWQKIEAGEYAAQQSITKSLIALRKTYSQLREERILWHHDAEHPRLVCYDRPGEQTLRVYLNNTNEEICVSGETVFAYRHESGKLLPGGIAITVFSCLQDFA